MYIIKSDEYTMISTYDNFGILIISSVISNNSL